MRLALDWTAEMQEWLERALKTYDVTTTASIQASKDLERLISPSAFREDRMRRAFVELERHKPPEKRYAR